MFSIESSTNRRFKLRLMSRFTGKIVFSSTIDMLSTNFRTPCSPILKTASPPESRAAYIYSLYEILSKIDFSRLNSYRICDSLYRYRRTFDLADRLYTLSRRGGSSWGQKYTRSCRHQTEPYEASAEYTLYFFPIAG